MIFQNRIKHHLAAPESRSAEASMPIGFAALPGAVVATSQSGPPDVYRLAHEMALRQLAERKVSKTRPHLN